MITQDPYQSVSLGALKLWGEIWQKHAVIRNKVECFIFARVMKL